MIGTPASRSDEECFRIADASLRELSKTRDLRIESDGDGAFLLEADGRAYRFVVGPGTAGPHVSGERRVIISWGDVPLPFALLPQPDVTYFDVRFGAHSRELDAVALELKACLERNGCVFRTFSSPPRARGPLRALRSILRR
jgi:hypothetical protein